MDNKSTTKRMIGAVVLVLIAALLLAWLLKGKNKSVQEQQDIMAEQTQEAAPILGFPGVSKDGEEAADGQVAQNGEAAQDGSGSYVIGAADQATDNAQQQAQNALAAGGDAAATAGQTIADGANATANAAAAAGQEVANATGFQVRDAKTEGEGTEQRQIVEGGEVKAGTGSMGGTEVAANTAETQQAADTGAAATTAAASGDATQAAPATQQPKVAAADGSAVAQPEAPKKVANPKLVNEKPVPAPKTQTAKASGSDAGSSASGSNSGSTQVSASSGNAGSSAASGQAAGAEGYAIQVLAASSRNKAETVKKDIARDGYPAFVVRANVNGKTVYRVRVGTYPAKGAARAVQTRMKARYTKNQYVQNSFVTKN